MNSTNNLYLIYLHMNGVDPTYIEGHAIVAGKLANSKITDADTYIKECNKHGINHYSGGDVMPRFFEHKRIHTRDNMKSYIDYNAYSEECNKCDVRVLYSEDLFAYIRK
jgi:hypothetical protein